MSGASTSQRHAAVDQMRVTGDVARFVGGEKHRERRNFCRRAEPAHRLAVDEALFHLLARPSGLFRSRSWAPEYLWGFLAPYDHRIHGEVNV